MLAVGVCTVTVSDIVWSRKAINPAVIIACTKQSCVMMYDIRMSGKGILVQKMGDYTLNRVKLRSNEDLMVADGNANLWEFAYRKPVKERGKMYRRYCGFIGAVTDFEMHPTNPWIASVGLGRTLVLHHMKVPRLPMWKKYLKQKVRVFVEAVTCFVMLTRTFWRAAKGFLVSILSEVSMKVA